MMTDMMDITLTYVKANPIPTCFIFVFLLQKAAFYRSLRSVLLPALALLTIYRSFSDIFTSDCANIAIKDTVLGQIISYLESLQTISSSVLLAGAMSSTSALLINRSIHIVGDVFGIVLFLAVIRLCDAVTNSSFRKIKSNITSYVFGLLQLLPPVTAKLNKEKLKIENDFEKDLKSKSRCIGDSITSLPVKGMPYKDIKELMHSNTKKENVMWQTGRVSGAVYHGVQAHQDLLNEAFSLYSIANPLHPDIWPSGMKFESEIIAMTKSLVSNGCSSVCGSTTSGGTESIILAIKSHRDYYCKKYGITEPEMIVSSSAHAAVDKACDLMNIKLIKIPMLPGTYQFDLIAGRHSIGPNTIMMYSSAPSYPQGVIDPIKEMSDLAVEFGIGLHVDCCLGGFFLPFAKKLGHNVPDYDFSLPGVSSMSLDTHKYGYALKGTSVVLYRTRELRQAQYFCYADWTGGLYTTPTIAGSRSSGLIAQCWASLVALGEEGYMKHTKDILNSCKIIAAGVSSIKGLQLLGKAEVMIVCFTTDPNEKKLNIYSVADLLGKRGWSINSHQDPVCVHICCTVRQVGRESEFLNDLKECVEEVRSSTSGKLNGNAAIYGMTSSLPAGPVNEILKIYNDVVLNT